MKHNSPELINSLIDKVESKKFDKDVFEKTGVFVVRDALPKELVSQWKEEWDKFYDEKLALGRNVNVNNPVDLKEELPPTLAKIYKNDIL